MKRLIQALSFLRFLVGATALVRSFEGADLLLVTTLITFAAIAAPAITWLRRKARLTPSHVEERFDEFTDYLTLIIAPWVLIRLVLVTRRNYLQEVLLDLPLLTGAIQFARRAGPDRDAREGLSPAFFAFVAVTMIFLNLPVLVTDARLTLILVPAVAISSVLMVVPIRYPELSGVLLPIVLVLIAAMPFVYPQLLAGAVVLLGCLYVLIAPFFARHRIDG